MTGFLLVAVRCSDGRVNIYAAATLVEAHHPVHKGEDGVILAHTDVAPWNPLRAALADDDVSGDDGLAAEFFHAQALAATVATVFDTTLTFLVGHDEISFLKMCGVRR